MTDVPRVRPSTSPAPSNDTTESLVACAQRAQELGISIVVDVKGAPVEVKDGGLLRMARNPAIVQRELGVDPADFYRVLQQAVVDELPNRTLVIGRDAPASFRDGVAGNADPRVIVAAPDPTFGVGAAVQAPPADLRGAIAPERVSGWEKFADGFVAVITRILVFGWFTDVYDPKQNHEVDTSGFQGHGVELMLLGGSELKHYLAPPVRQSTAEQRLATLMRQLNPTIDQPRAQLLAAAAYAEMQPLWEATPSSPYDTGPKNEPLTDTQLNWFRQMLLRDGSRAGDIASTVGPKVAVVGDKPRGYEAIGGQNFRSDVLAAIDALQPLASDPVLFEATLAARVPQLANLPETDRQEVVQTLRRHADNRLRATELLSVVVSSETELRAGWMPGKFWWAKSGAFSDERGQVQTPNRINPGAALAPGVLLRLLHAIENQSATGAGLLPVDAADFFRDPDGVVFALPNLSSEKQTMIAAFAEEMPPDIDQFSRFLYAVTDASQSLATMSEPALKAALDLIRTNGYSHEAMVAFRATLLPRAPS